ncbi:RCC1-like G exchanging factor-like protein [Schistosoma japonicum]|uniref:RCC1-like G exchanging factor-like protein n=1 Tax=Schistosoma japonicum TaxID=6182 RepID=A0A4Z2CTV5_SCHJA|nr:RCC1-like G exchanging factor-like protein [Schistosoma japonicum]TNN07553.1 RCC1-like G exchanging factor-like protein [Schistosoma japonicum]
MPRPFFALVSKCRLWTFCASYTSNKALKRQRQKDSAVYDVHSRDSLKSKQVYVFGFTATGALGNKTYLGQRGKPGIVGVSHPVPLKCLSSLGIPIKAACGYGFTTYICEGSNGDFGVYGCGINSDGQLGSQSVGLKSTLDSGDSINVVPEPVRIHIPLNNAEKQIYRPSHVACGRAHTIISYENLKGRSGDTPPLVFSLGNNVFGQCGREIIAGEKYDHDTEVITRIVLPPEIQSIKQLVCGQDHSILLSSDGVVYTCGLGSDGQTGLGHYDTVDRFTAVKGALINERVCLLSSRGDTVLALTESNKLFAWGNNEYGQIWPLDQHVQVPDPIHLNLDQCIVPAESNLCSDNVHIGEVQSIACAGSMCCIVNKIGQVFVWGFGCIGLGPKVTHSPCPTLIPPGLFIPAVVNSELCINYVVAGLHHFIVQSVDGLLWSWGAPRGGLHCLGLGKQITKNANNQTYPTPLLLPIKSTYVVCGVDHTVVIGKSFG